MDEVGLWLLNGFSRRLVDFRCSVVFSEDCSTAVGMFSKLDRENGNELACSLNDKKMACNFAIVDTEVLENLCAVFT